MTKKIVLSGARPTGASWGMGQRPMSTADATRARLTMRSVTGTVRISAKV